MTAAAALAGVSVAAWLLRGGHADPGMLFAYPAWAQEAGPLIDPMGDIAADDDESTTAAVHDANLAVSMSGVFASDPLQSLADALHAREAELDRREREVREAQQRLDTVRLEIEQNLRRTEEALAEMRRLAGAADQQREAEIKKWIQIYEGMKPDKAGPMIGALDPAFQLDLLARMDTRKAGKILESMDPQTARMLALELAGSKP